MVIGQLQGAFKTLLKCVKTSLYLTFAPGRIRLRVQQTDPQVSTNNLGMFVSKWFAEIGVEFIWDPATLDCLFERLMKGVAVGC